MLRFPLKLSHLYYIILFLILTLASHNIFFGLNSFPISSWDEARHGVSAYEMLKKGNYIVNTYREHTDYWNLKPPLSFWANIAGYKIAGFNPLGLRLVSAVSAMLTIAAVAFFVFLKYGKSASLLSMLTLATSPQFLINHSARTGDADSLFVFLFTLSILSLLLSNSNVSWLFLSGLCFALGFLTKSWHAGNIFLVIVLYLLASGNYKKLTLRHSLILALCMFTPILLWAGVRYQYDGMKFFKNMISYDLLKRSSNSIEGHIGDGFYYLKVLWDFFHYWLLLLGGVLLMYFTGGLTFKSFKTTEERKHLIGLCLWILIPFVLFSIAKTKIRWYILPVYPPLSILIGILAGRLMVQAKFMARIALLVSLLFVSFYYEGKIERYLQSPPSKLQLNLIQTIQNKKEFKGYTLFLHQPSLAKWTQNMVLTSELYNDSSVEDGGINGFLKKDRALLLIKKGKDAKEMIASNHFYVISSNHWGYIVGKNKQ